MLKKKIGTLILTLMIGLTLVNVSGISAYAESSEETGSGSVKEKPAWYPEDPKNFTFFHDENAPRVVDEADIFTDAEEAAMEARISELREELKKDIVVYTDMSDYGLGRDIWCADFYDFNGYGYGDEHEGYCLFICMDPNNRGFWTASTGSVSRALHTETIANALDDVLYEYMVNGKYGEGALDWVENIGRLYKKGSPFAPDWYPNVGEEVKLHHNRDVVRVCQDYKILTQEQLNDLETRVRDLSAKMDMDIVIYLAYCPSGIQREDHIDTFYRCWGYGFGDDYRGVVLAIFPYEEHSEYKIYTYGAGHELIGKKSLQRLYDHIDVSDENRDYISASKFLDDLEAVHKTGRVPKTAGAWIGSAVWAMIVGAVIGWILVSSAASKMKTIEPEEDANKYMIKDSFNLVPVKDAYVGTTSSKKYDPIQRKSSSSGGSSYRSSYSGSSGASHTGSGHSF